jgi:glucokinase
MGNASLIRKMNEDAVLSTVFKHGPITRVEISNFTGLSKPTVYSVVDSLLSEKLLIKDGSTSGDVGRAAKIFRVNPDAAYVIGIDLGGTNIRVGLANIFGEIVSLQTQATGKGNGKDILDKVLQLCRQVVETNEIYRDRVKAIVLGSPGILDPNTGNMLFAPNINGFGDLNVREYCERAFPAEIYIENDVNLAALGEQSNGLVKQNANFAFIAIGTGIGMGLVINGELHYGADNIAGELAYLPVGGNPYDPANKIRGTLEEAITGSGIKNKLREVLAKKPSAYINEDSTMKEVFEAAGAKNDPSAKIIIEYVAKLIAQAILAISIIVNPDLIVLGGGIGSNELLLKPVLSAVSQVNPVKVKVEISLLGDQATLYGAIALGVKKVREQLFRQ